MNRLRSLLAAAAVAVLGVGLVGCLKAAPAQAAPGTANRLAKETSPYLLLHARNPVDWYPWGPEAFEKAKREGKPVFLSVGYSACHWCHVMARESFEDEETARLLNEVCVPIKVDREERPDVDDVYMTAVQLQTGSGGWPMSVFLTPEARPFFGATYLRKADFQKLLREVKEAWADPKRRKTLEDEGVKLAAAIGKVGGEAPKPGSISPAVFEPAVKSYLEQLDGKNGGFGGAPKFPPATRLGLLLTAQRREQLSAERPRAEKAVRLTLERMARGGVYDQVGGGFHRYAVDEKWLVPHFEKMLYDNALLAWVYLEASRETKDPAYQRVARETLDFALRELRDPKGGFWSTLNAESPDASGASVEGAFYVWTPAEVQAVLGATDGPLFCKLYGITAQGNFEGRSIPNLLARPLDAWAKELKLAPEALQSRADAMRAKLRQAREKRHRPSLDDKVLASWNGLMIRALALAYDVTGESRYKDAAVQAAGFVLGQLRDPNTGRLMRSYRAGKTQPQAFLEDYSFMTVGLLDLHRATGDDRWLREARSLCGVMLAEYWDEGSGTFYNTPSHGEVLLARLNNAEDQATPSGQSMAALTMIRLSRLTKDAGLRAKSERILNTYATEMRRFPAAMSNMLLAADAWFSTDDTVIAQKPGDVGLPGQLPGLDDPAEKPKAVVAKLEGAPKSVKPGQEFELTLRLTIGEGWHVNSDKPADEFLVATKVELQPGPFKQVSVTYPPAITVKLGISEKPAKVFEGTALIKLKVKAGPGAEKAKDLRVKLRYQACNNEVCQVPANTLLTATIGK